MVDISVPNNQSITVSASTNNSIGANTNADAQLAYSWAVGQGLIQGIDYSSKYYAGQAKQSEEIATEAISHIGTSVEDASDYAQSASDSANAAALSAQAAQESAEYVVNNAPTVTVEQTSTGAIVTATDLQGTTIATILNGVDGQDGQDGADGADGFSPIATVSKSGNVSTLTQVFPLNL